MQLASRLLEKAQLRIEQAKAEKVWRCSISAESCSLVRRLTTRTVGLKLRRTQGSRVTCVRLTDGSRVTLAHACFPVLGIKLMPD